MCCGVCWLSVLMFFVFKQKTAYEMRISDWSSDVCSSDLEQVLPVAVLGQRPGERLELRGIDPSVVVGNLLRAAHAQALARLDGLDVVRCLQQRLVRARLEPRVAAAKLFEVQPALLEIAAVEVGAFQFAPRRRLERGSEVAGTPVVEVQPGHRVVRADRKSTRLNSSH